MDRRECHKYAAHCVSLAQHAHSPEQKALFIEMAQAWLQLAEQSERIEALMPKGKKPD